MKITETAHQQDLDAFLKEVMRRKKRLPSHMAADLGVSHATVLRWLSGEDKPSTESCRKLADYSGESLQKIFSLAGHMPGMEQPISSNLPEFREYVRSKYPNKLDEDIIAIIETIIERPLDRKRSKARSKACVELNYRRQLREMSNRSR